MGHVCLLRISWISVYLNLVHVFIPVFFRQVGQLCTAADCVLTVPTSRAEATLLLSIVPVLTRRNGSLNTTFLSISHLPRDLMYDVNPWWCDDCFLDTKLFLPPFLYYILVSIIILTRLVPCTGFDYFTSGWSRTWPDLGSQILLELEPDQDLGRTCFGIQKSMPHENIDVSSAVSCYKEAVQFSASFVTSPFASFWRSLWNGNGFCIFIVEGAIIKIANTPLDRSAVLFLSTINWL